MDLRICSLKIIFLHFVFVLIFQFSFLSFQSLSFSFFFLFLFLSSQMGLRIWRLKRTFSMLFLSFFCGHYFFIILTESIDIILFLLFSYIIFVCFNFFIVLKVLIFIFLIIPISHITYVCFKFIFLFVLRNFAIFLICDIPLSDRYISNV